jgi:hypothetical protein
MISAENKPINATTSDADFTVTHYRDLCQLAVKNYPIADYRHIPWGERFLLWRHDMDFSLNRGLTLARIEHDIGLKGTYFFNPHCEFYNLAEAGQHAIVKDILALGHDIGLHFDASFFGDISEGQLSDLLAREADYLQWLFNVHPVAFSFHNPVTSTLRFEADTYGGLLNCYSKRFKTEVPYCSDSNGYWRFRRLHDVLIEAKDPCLQVLTHPGWWQDKPMPSRQRIFRAALGRVAGIMRTYDETLAQHSRLNHSGAAESLSILKKPQLRRFQLCDYLWNQGEFQTLFVELWRTYESQINRLCKAQFRKEWAVPSHEVNAFFSSDGLGVDGWKLFSAVFNESWASATGVDEDDYRAWHSVRNQVIHGRSSIAPAELEQGCVVICEIISRLAQWGSDHSIGYDGLAHLGSIGLPTLKTADGSLVDILDEVKDNIKGFSEKRWVAFKGKLAELEKLEDVKATRR